VTTKGRKTTKVTKVTKKQFVLFVSFVAFVVQDVFGSFVVQKVARNPTCIIRGW
jgi:hypothetical protein